MKLYIYYKFSEINTRCPINIADQFIGVTAADRTIIMRHPVIQLLKTLKRKINY